MSTSPLLSVHYWPKPAITLDMLVGSAWLRV
jgi:hypothetical protein